MKTSTADTIIRYREVTKTMKPRYHFFLSYSNKDRIKADKFFNTLDKYFHIFYAPYSIKLGEEWPKKIRLAQKDSLTTLILYSNNTENAYYQNEEIIRAIEGHRNGKQKIIPIALDSVKQTPLGLKLIQGISLDQINDKNTLIKIFSEHINDIQKESKTSLEFKLDPELENIEKNHKNEFEAKSEFKKEIESQINLSLRKLWKAKNIHFGFMDIDGFGNLNRLFTSHFGDIFLMKIEKIIADNFEGFFVRLLSDEFIFIFENQRNELPELVFLKVYNSIINYDWSKYASDFYFDLSFGYSILDTPKRDKLSLENNEVKSAIKRSVLGMKKSKEYKNENKINPGPTYLRSRSSDYDFWPECS